LPLEIEFCRKDASMIAQIAIAPLVALIAGIVILIAPRLLNYVVALYLIIIGVMGLFPQLLS
jgi:general stress protein CsbA